MRRLLATCLFALCVFTVPARADVRRTQISLRLDSPSTWADSLATEAGFVLSSPVGGRVTHIEVMAGGRARPLQTPDAITLATGGSASVRFARDTASFASVVTVRYDWNGVTTEREFDFTPGSSLTRALRARQERDRLVISAARPAAQPFAALAGATVRVHGRFQVAVSGGVPVALDGLPVYVYQRFGTTAWAIGSGTSSPTGDFDITVNSPDAAPSLYVQIAAETPDFQVMTALDPTTPASYETRTYANIAGPDLPVGTITLDWGREELLVASVLSRVYQWSRILGRTPPFVKVLIDVPAADASYYDQATSTIHLKTVACWRVWTIAHEWAHHWLDTFALAPDPPEYCNAPCDGGGTNCQHQFWCPENTNVAWIEGFPDFLMARFDDWWKSTYLANPPGTTPEFEWITDCFDCGLTGTVPDAERVEGITAAFLWDLVDAASDDPLASEPPWNVSGADRLSMSLADIMNVLDSDNPTSLRLTVLALVAHYPALAVQIWQAGMLNHMDFDSHPPAAPTNLLTTSQLVNTPTNDAVFRLSWTAATDDLSGVLGYNVQFSPSAAAPAPTDTTTYLSSWTSPAQPSGSCYVCIRSVDRSGQWSSPLVVGPYVINAPGTADLTSIVPTNWDAPVVPRTTAGATTTNAHAPATLAHDVGLYLNYAYTNAGPGGATGTSVSAQYQWCGTYMGGGVIVPGGAPAGAVLYDLNDFASTYTRNAGGRKTVGYIIDDQAHFAEPSETNNQWAKQWIWTSLDITALGVSRRSAAFPARWGLAAIPSGQPAEDNCTGFRFSLTGKWDAVTLLAQDGITDLDLALYTPSASSTSGFNAASERARSATLGELDAVIVHSANPALAGQTVWDAGVTNRTGSTSKYYVEHVASVDLPYATYGVASLPDTSSLRLYAVNIPAGPRPYSVVLQVTDANPGNRPLKLALFTPGHSFDGILGATAYALTDASGYARIDVAAPLAGDHGISVYREVNTGYAAVGFTIAVVNTGPDMVAYAPSGWYSPLVPLDSPSGSPGSVPLPTVLLGDGGPTYVNIAIGNIGPAPAPQASPADAAGPGGPRSAAPTSANAVSVSAEIHLDGVTLTTVTTDTLAGGASQVFNLGTPFVIGGGRHTLSEKIDPQNTSGDMSPKNNTYGDSWVWTPATLPIGSTVVRPVPPDPVGGWAELTAVPSAAFNCDGLRLAAVSPVGENGHWVGLATTPLPNTDVDLALYEVYTNARSGFDLPLAGSRGGTGATDYLVVNGNVGTPRAFDVGITRGGGSVISGCVAQAVASTWLGAATTGTFGPFTLGPTQLLALHEATLPAGRYSITLENTAGAVDWGMTVHDPARAFGGRDSSLAGGLSWQAAAGLGESADVTLAAGGRALVAVWKAAAADLNSSGSYVLHLSPGPLGVPGQSPATLTALLGARPNPAVEGTSISFALASEGEASVAVYDVRGALVRALQRGKLAAGRHEVRWDGRDARGRSAPAGVYFVRLEAGAVRDVRKLVRLE